MWVLALSSDTISVAFLLQQSCLGTGTDTSGTIAEVATAVAHLNPTRWYARARMTCGLWGTPPV